MTDVQNQVPRLRVLAALTAVLFLAACGGGTDRSFVSSPPNGSTPTPPGADPLEEVNSIVLSHAIFDLQNRRERVDEWECREDLSFICTARLGSLQAYADPRGAFSYRVLGEWEHMHVAGVFQDATTLFAASAGVVYRDSLPAGGARWTGRMVGVYRPPETPLGNPGRVVRGGAEIALRDLGSLVVDVTLTPRTLPAMVWTDIPVRTDGGFYQPLAVTTDAPHPGPPNRAAYIRGEFYGPNAEEVGGVFERAGITGAFGAKR